MKLKEYLIQYRICCKKYHGILNSIESLRSIAEKTTRVLNSDRVSSSSQDRLGDIGAVLADAETEANQELIVLFTLMREIEKFVLSISDDRYRVLLQYKYIDGLTLLKTSEKMGYSYDYVRELHGKALLEINSPQ